MWPLYVPSNKRSNTHFWAACCLNIWLCASVCAFRQKKIFRPLLSKVGGWDLVCRLFSKIYGVTQNNVHHVLAILYSIFKVNITQVYFVVQCITVNEVQLNELWFWKWLSERKISNCAVIWQTAWFDISLKIFQLWMFSDIWKKWPQRRYMAEQNLEISSRICQVPCVLCQCTVLFSVFAHNVR